MEGSAGHAARSRAQCNAAVPADAALPAGPYPGGDLGSPLAFLKDFSADSISFLFGPYILVCSPVMAVLGVLIFRQRAMAAVALLGFSVVADVLTRFVHVFDAPPFGAVGSTVDVSFYVFMLVLTAVIVIADRAARGAQARR